MIRALLLLALLSSTACTASGASEAPSVHDDEPEVTLAELGQALFDGLVIQPLVAAGDMLLWGPRLLATHFWASQAPSVKDVGQVHPIVSGNAINGNNGNNGNNGDETIVGQPQGIPTSLGWIQAEFERLEAKVAGLQAINKQLISALMASEQGQLENIKKQQQARLELQEEEEPQGTS